MSHSQFKFKSSGVRSDNRKFKKPVSVLRPYGIKTPMSLGDDIFVMNNDPISQISDNFRNLILTNFGERLGRYDFGANLRALVYEYSGNPDFESIVEKQISDATDKFMPQVKIISVSSQLIETNEKNSLNTLGLAKVTLRIVYCIPSLKTRNLGVEVDLFIGG
jgi:phage baseplate assembly protein W